ncbi:MAG: hypothetical protein HY744_29435 [Deltaproteobacteria bacterium]|nr:hypothetical protein [Deltaproteobacteria bacterium]
MSSRSLDAFVGAHPAALREIYGAGTPADPAELGADSRGRLLALEPLAGAFLVTRRVVVGAGRVLPWQGKAFDPDGAGGHNRVLGRRVLRFRCEPGPSELDGRPTLLLRYDGVGNPWPISALVDELRRVGDGVAIGPASLLAGRATRLLFWWGLERMGA